MSPKSSPETIAHSAWSVATSHLPCQWLYQSVQSACHTDYNVTWQWNPNNFISIMPALQQLQDNYKQRFSMHRKTEAVHR